MLWKLTAIEAAQRIRDGLITSQDLVSACLDHIADTDADIGAWVHLDPDQALTQAKAMDRIRQTGRPTGLLHGVPVGIKDIFDTADMPTECGTPIYKGRQPEADAAVVSKLKEAGAVIMGKTATTEFAFMHPARTSNPHNRDRSPGGSSSGSAAAVAAGHVPLAIGSQTNGSTIRPAAFCGIYGFKPTSGVIARTGVLQTSQTLDQAGVFARTLDDAALLADMMAGYDRGDAASYARPMPAMLAGARTAPPIEPSLAWFELPFNDRLDDAARDGLEELIAALGGRIERLPAPDSFSTVVECHKIIHEFEFCRHLKDTVDGHWDQISATLRPAIERGRSYSRDQYDDALALVGGARDYFEEFFHDYDAVLTPAASGEAPLKSTGTGDPIFCTIWTFAGLPSLSLPLLTGETGLPVGVQLVGSREHDDRLLRTTAWLLQTLEQGSIAADA